MKKYICIVVILFFSRVYAETYFIDFNKGKDSQPGTSAEAAWKHAPGDTNATETVKAVKLKPGDVVLFKGGVIYRGSIEIPASGEVGKLITYKGNGWGTDKAILDGSAVVGSKWTQCTSAEQLRGNTNYRNVYYTTTAEEKYYTIDKDGTLALSGVYENHEFIYASQDPQPADRVFSDRDDQLRVLPVDPAVSPNDGSIMDTRYFTQKDPAFYEGAYMAIRQGGYTNLYKIIGFDSATHTVSRKTTKNYDVKGQVHYAILNHPAYLNAPGQYWLDQKSKRLYVWPRSSTNPADNEYSVSLNSKAVVAGGKHLLIEGFVVEKFGGREVITAGNSDVEIRNNVVRNCKSHLGIHTRGANMRVINNQIIQSAAHGIWCEYGTNIFVKNNLVQHSFVKGIMLMGVNHGLIIDNIVDEVRGQHAPSGIIVSQNSKDILVAGNKVFKTDRAMVYGGGKEPSGQENVYIYNNLFCGSIENITAKMSFDITLLNNTSLGGTQDVGIGKGRQIFINNIVHGSVSSNVRSHNLFTAHKSGDLKLAEGEMDWSTKDKNEIFVDMAKNDCHLKAGSPAIEAGIDPSQYLPVALFPEYDFYKDIEGKPRQKGGKWSLGAYEYSPAKK